MSEEPKNFGNSKWLQQEIFKKRIYADKIITLDYKVIYYQYDIRISTLQLTRNSCVIN